MREIPLSQGYVALVDDEDYDRVMAAGKWFVWVGQNTRTAYAWTHVRLADGSRTTLKLHRFLTDAPAGLSVDHVDGNGLNNTRANLRVVTHAENLRNQQLRSDSTSGRRGVTWDASRSRWKARIKLNGRRTEIGRFLDLDDAARAYDKAAREMFGEHGAFNFPEVGERSAITGEIREA